LHLKNIDFEQRTIDMIGHEQGTEEFSNKTTPFALIPVFIDKELVINESLAIIEYLEEKYPDKLTLLPGSIEDRAKIRALSLQIIANTQPLQNLRVLEHLSDDAEIRQKWAKYWVELSFTKLEKVLKETARKYAYGDKLSLLDICIPPQVYNAKRFGVDLSNFPTIGRIDKVLAEISEFKKSGLLPSTRHTRC